MIQMHISFDQFLLRKAFFLFLYALTNLASLLYDTKFSQTRRHSLQLNDVITSSITHISFFSLTHLFLWCFINIASLLQALWACADKQVVLSENIQSTSLDNCLKAAFKHITNQKKKYINKLITILKNNFKDMCRSKIKLIKFYFYQN